MRVFVALLMGRSDDWPQLCGVATSQDGAKQLIEREAGVAMVYDDRYLPLDPLGHRNVTSNLEEIGSYKEGRIVAFDLASPYAFDTEVSKQCGGATSATDTDLPQAIVDWGPGSSKRDIPQVIRELEAQTGGAFFTTDEVAKILAKEAARRAMRHPRPGQRPSPEAIREELNHQTQRAFCSFIGLSTAAIDEVLKSLETMDPALMDVLPPALRSFLRTQATLTLKELQKLRARFPQGDEHPRP